MGFLRIVNVGPIVRKHYGTLWHDSQHPVRYIAFLLGVPLLISLLGQVLIIDGSVAKWFVGLFTIVLGFSARAAFKIPQVGEDDGERKSKALRQLRRGAMYAVLVGIVSFITSVAVAGAYLIGTQNPAFVARLQSVATLQVIEASAIAASMVLIFLLAHYVLTLLVLVRWLFLMSEAGSL